KEGRLAMPLWYRRVGEGRGERGEIGGRREGGRGGGRGRGKAGNRGRGRGRRWKARSIHVCGEEDKGGGTGERRRVGRVEKVPVIAREGGREGRSLPPSRPRPTGLKEKRQFL
ncbi:hypothetical protein Naga_102988g1, partial [Nannochloropsis gaditana]